jgi:hypothetical protein
MYLFNRYKKTAAIAASIAGITALGHQRAGFIHNPGRSKKQKLRT